MKLPTTKLIVAVTAIALISIVQTSVVCGQASGTKTQEVKAKKLDPKKLLGEWKVVRGERAGEEVGEDRLPEISISKKEITIPVPDADAFVMEYKLDLDKSPVSVDIKIVEGPAPESEALGILKMEDGKVFLCYDPMGSERPEKFETSEEDGFFMFVMEKAKD